MNTAFGKTVVLTQKDKLPAWRLNARVTGMKATVVIPERMLSRDDEFPLETNFGAQHLTMSLSIDGEQYFMLLFTMNSDLFNKFVETASGEKALGPKHGFVVDFHFSKRQLSGRPRNMLHRERWYSTREKANAAVKELFDLLNSLTVEEIFNLRKLPDFQCPSAGGGKK